MFPKREGTMKRAIAAGWAFAFVACGGAFASEHTHDCATLLADTQIRDLTLMRVTATDRVHFADCTAATCQTKSYVVPGDLLVAASEPGDLVCVVFPNNRGGTKGWIPSGFLSPAPIEANPPLAAWTGKWQLHNDAEIEIRIEGSELAVKGQAFWTSGAPGVIHDGELVGKNRPKGDMLQLPNPEAFDALESADNPENVCQAELRLVGPYLVARDNLRCGGMNVSFTGAYRRL
jgi:hypothetical protein